MHLLVLFISNLRDARSYNPKVPTSYERPKALMPETGICVKKSVAIKEHTEEFFTKLNFKQVA